MRKREKRKEKVRKEKGKRDKLKKEWAKLILDVYRAIIITNEVRKERKKMTKETVRKREKESANK